MSVSAEAESQAEITQESLVALVKAVTPQKQRTSRALHDDVVDFAVRLDELSLARFKADLGGVGVNGQDWMKVVKQRRADLAAKAQREAWEDEERSMAGSPAGALPQINISKLKFHEVNSCATEALARLSDLYEYQKRLVLVVESKDIHPGEHDHPRTELEIEGIAPAYLRDLMSRAADWLEDGMPAHPPEWCAFAVHTSLKRDPIRHLRHVSDVPVVLPNGSILAKPGYDPKTRILYWPQLAVPQIPEFLIQEDVRRAAEKLLDLLYNFPMERPAHRSSWLAGVLTPIARWAFVDQSPMFIYDANQSASGKSLLAKMTGWISLGREMDFFVPTSDEEEERKRITSKILGGATMVLIDNIDKPFGSAAIEALLTTGTWGDRLLGTNNAPKLQSYIIWYASGTNMQFKRVDTRRRCCMIRIVTPDIRPEERSGFKYPNIKAHIREHRGELFAAALTILAGWLRSGQRAKDLPGWEGPWGDCDDWDQVVRGAILYAGLPDILSVKGTGESAGPDIEGLAGFVDGLEEAVARLGTFNKEIDSKEVATTTIALAMKEDDEGRRFGREVKLKKMNEAIDSVAKGTSPRSAPNSGSLGTIFGRYKDKPVMLEGKKRRIVGRQDKHRGVTMWRVETMAEPARVEPASW